MVVFDAELGNIHFQHIRFLCFTGLVMKNNDTKIMGLRHTAQPFTIDLICLGM
jgi:hypothetical protein